MAGSATADQAPSDPVEANRGVRARVRAVGKVLEWDDRQQANTRFAHYSKIICAAVAAGDMDDEFQRCRSLRAHRSKRSLRRHVGKPQLGLAVLRGSERPKVRYQEGLRRGTHCHTT